MTTVLLQAIGLAVPLIVQLLGFITKSTQTINQDKEKTPEQDAELQGYLTALKDAPKPWQKEQPI